MSNEKNGKVRQQFIVCGNVDSDGDARASSDDANACATTGRGGAATSEQRTFSAITNAADAAGAKP